MQYGKNVHNLVGFRTGMLSVVEYAGRAADRQALWRCQCDCGRETVVCAGSLVNSRTRSCGCMRRRRWCGKIIGKIYIAKYLYETEEHKAGYLCMCVCGKKFLAATPSSIDTIDCGCGTKKNFCIDKGGKSCLARRIYELFYHVKLTRDDVLVFLDNDKSNISIDNLRVVKRKTYNKITDRGITDAGLKNIIISNAELLTMVDEIKERFYKG